MGEKSYFLSYDFLAKSHTPTFSHQQLILNERCIGESDGEGKGEFIRVLRR